MGQTLRQNPTQIQPGFIGQAPIHYFSADNFPSIHPVHWLHSHFAVGGWSPLSRLGGMLTAHMTAIAPRNGFTWHPHRALEIYTWVLEGELYHEDTTGGRGVIRAGELQRMFAGDYIEHQELNRSDAPARVIQIWYMADPRYRGVEPHYQQVGRTELPSTMYGDARVYDLIGGASPMQQHMQGRLTATSLPAHGTTTLQPPRDDEDLFVYITDGSGTAQMVTQSVPLSQYDVLLARPDAPIVTFTADAASLDLLSFYLPKFL
jgi:hypothetical protein